MPACCCARNTASAFITAATAALSWSERKKFGSYIYKEAAPLTHAEFDAILAGDYDFLLHSPRRLCQEFYTECVCNVLRPRVIVDYDREP